MTADLAIRPYSPTDKAAVLDIWLATSTIAHPFFSSEQLQEQRVLVGDVYLEKAETWVAEMDGTVVGFIGLLDTWIGGLFVSPSVQGKGVGRALVDHAIALKKELALEVYETNMNAIGFYERLGFSTAGRRDTDDNGLPFPLLKMRRGA
ncbi:putative acetyltransferase [Pseudorhizobium tarimense]|uniref:Acetyltransferase n=1 Tax=Pseudorhizobium tarimense TaxID=1079109 RepID=A0ABV2H5H5_9HYPH|nr:GNAT family N-acetyltransferase [Pseudorhizobium tarimense]